MHRVKLMGDTTRRDVVDQALLERCKGGEIGWVAALGLEQADVAALRAHGRALCHAGRYAEALDVLAALPFLGEPDRHDALFLAFCYEGLGELEKAEHCFAAARRFNDAIEAELAKVTA